MAEFYESIRRLKKAKTRRHTSGRASRKDQIDNFASKKRTDDHIDTDGSSSPTSPLDGRKERRQYDVPFAAQGGNQRSEVQPPKGPAGDDLGRLFLHPIRPMF